MVDTSKEAVARYDIDYTYGVYRDEDGEWIKASDYDAISAQLAEAQAEIDRLRDVAVEVEELEWVESAGGYWVAPNILHGNRYIVSVDAEHDCWDVSLDSLGSFAHSETVDGAKAIADEHHKLCALSSIQARTAAEVYGDGWNAAIEAAAREVDCGGCQHSECMSPGNCAQDDVKAILALTKKGNE